MATKKVLMLSPYGTELARAFTDKDIVEWRDDQPITENDIGGYDWVVCYGYRRIIREPFISSFRGRLINLHISYLPFNRGADPNFWSWFDDTPKGVSLHEIDADLDTGRLLAQAKVTFNDISKHTLATSYVQLQKCAVTLFESVWPGIRGGSIHAWPQEPVGTYHRSIDKEPIMEVLPLGWDTPVSVIMSLGADARKAEA